jgi:hypothetical protein
MKRSPEIGIALHEGGRAGEDRHTTASAHMSKSLPADAGQAALLPQVPVVDP